MDAVFALIDANNFYASCEQVFDPKLRGKPVIILSNNDGCVVSRSLEARKLGIKMGVPLFQIEQIIDAHDVQVFSSNYPLYGDVSNRLMAVLQEFTPEVEIYSIDEGFMNLAGIHCESYQALGKAIQERVYKNTCVPVTVGIGETKTLAKVANYIAKKSERAAGVLDLARSRFQEEALRRTPADEIWGIGPAYSKLLKENGINTALELRDADLGWARKALTVVGARIVLELRGIRCLSLEVCPRPRKSVTVSRSFPVAIEKLEELKEAVAVFSSRASEKLRRDNLAAGAITVFVETSRFVQEAEHYANSATLELIYPTDDTQELLQNALFALRKVFRPGLEYRRAGVLLSGLAPARELTGRLFDNETMVKFRRVMPVMDTLNAKYGRGTLRFATARPNGRWKTKAARSSPHYTTRLSDIPTLY
jgi:DNA polymerase V